VARRTAFGNGVSFPSARRLGMASGLGSQVGSNLQWIPVDACGHPRTPIRYPRIGRLRDRVPPGVSALSALEMNLVMHPGLARRATMNTARRHAGADALPVPVTRRNRLVPLDELDITDLPALVEERFQRVVETQDSRTSPCREGSGSRWTPCPPGLPDRSRRSPNR
jgi:hypothetical protein